MLIILICYCCLSPGEPFNGQLEVPDSTNEEDEDLQRETDTNPEQSAGTFPVIQPGRFPSHQPENQVPAVHPPRRNRDYNWKQIGTTECTTTCGKGKYFTARAQNIYYITPWKSPAWREQFRKPNPATPWRH